MTAWFSARLWFVILVDDKRSRHRHDYDESIVLFRARDFSDAFKRALAIGSKAEVEYRNDRGQRVRWAFVEVDTIDRLGRRLDGREVGSRLRARSSSKPIPFGRRFHPERSKPGSSGIS